MRTYLIVPIALLTAAAGAYGEDAAPTVSGTWQMQPDRAVTWTLAQDGNKIHIEEAKGAEVMADYTCNVMGKDCEMKDSGHSEKTSLWFNGAVLVELRTRGASVVQRRFEVGKDGKTMDVEVSSISPPGKAEKLEFTREDASAKTAQTH